MNGLKNKTSILGVYLLTFLYSEFLFRILILGFGKTFNLANINIVVFCIALASCTYLISRILPEKANKWIFYIIMALVAVWFSAQFVVKDVFDFYISCQIFKEAGQITEGAFLKETVVQTALRIPQIIGFFLPFIISLFLKKHLQFKRIKFAKFILVLVFAALAFIGNYYALNINKGDYYSPYNLYHKINNPALSIETSGVLNTFFVDIRKEVTNFKEKIIIVKKDKKEKEKEKEKKYSYNNLNINFDALKEASGDPVVQEMTDYFKNEEGTLQNKYTGMFKGKNLIVFMAESFNEIAVDEELTPTLYKMIHNGFEFTNFYSPTIYSTIGGEMQELTSLYPASYGAFKAGGTYFPMGIGNLFNNAGYNTYAFHDHSYTFQGRNLYLQDMGFNNFLGCWNGLENRIDCNQWPESDIDFINATYTDYINSDKPFMVFMATVSGHGSYSETGAISSKYIDLVNDKYPKYSVNIRAYMAAQMELDRALESLLKHLEEAGKLDDTVIALVGDHYPYMISVEEINGRGKEAKDANVEISRSNFILYNSKMKKVTVDKVGSQIDVMPTLYNLFGLPYDSRLLIGKDILSTEEGLAIFGNRSWVSDKGTYFADKRQFVPKEGVTVDDTYVDTMNQVVSGKISMSGYIMDVDYYRIAWNYLEQEPQKKEEKPETQKDKNKTETKKEA